MGDAPKKKVVVIKKKKVGGDGAKFEKSSSTGRKGYRKDIDPKLLELIEEQDKQEKARKGVRRYMSNQDRYKEAKASTQSTKSDRYEPLSLENGGKWTQWKRSKADKNGVFKLQNILRGLRDIQNPSNPKDEIGSGDYEFVSRTMQAPWSDALGDWDYDKAVQMAGTTDEMYPFKFSTANSGITPELLAKYFFGGIDPNKEYTIPLSRRFPVSVSQANDNPFDVDAVDSYLNRLYNVADVMDLENAREEDVSDLENYINSTKGANTSRVLMDALLNRDTIRRSGKTLAEQGASPGLTNALMSLLSNKVRSGATLEPYEQGFVDTHPNIGKDIMFNDNDYSNEELMRRIRSQLSEDDFNGAPINLPFDNPLWGEFSRDIYRRAGSRLKQIDPDWVNSFLDNQRKSTESDGSSGYHYAKKYYDNLLGKLDARLSDGSIPEGWGYDEAHDLLLDPKGGVYREDSPDSASILYNLGEGIQTVPTESLKLGGLLKALARRKGDMKSATGKLSTLFDGPKTFVDIPEGYKPFSRRNWIQKDIENAINEAMVGLPSDMDNATKAKVRRNALHDYVNAHKGKDVDIDDAVEAHLASAGADDSIMAAYKPVIEAMRKANGSVSGTAQKNLQKLAQEASGVDSTTKPKKVVTVKSSTNPSTGTVAKSIVIDSQLPEETRTSSNTDTLKKAADAMTDSIIESYLAKDMAKVNAGIEDIKAFIRNEPKAQKHLNRLHEFIQAVKGGTLDDVAIAKYKDDIASRKQAADESQKQEVRVFGDIPDASQTNVRKEEAEAKAATKEAEVQQEQADRAEANAQVQQQQASEAEVKAGREQEEAQEAQQTQQNTVSVPNYETVRKEAVPLDQAELAAMAAWGTMVNGKPMYSDEDRQKARDALYRQLEAYKNLDTYDPAHAQRVRDRFEQVVSEFNKKNSTGEPVTTSEPEAKSESDNEDANKLRIDANNRLTALIRAYQAGNEQLIDSYEDKLDEILDDLYEWDEDSANEIEDKLVRVRQKYGKARSIVPSKKSDDDEDDIDVNKGFDDMDDDNMGQTEMEAVDEYMQEHSDDEDEDDFEYNENENSMLERNTDQYDYEDNTARAIGQRLDELKGW